MFYIDHFFEGGSTFRHAKCVRAAYKDKMGNFCFSLCRSIPTLRPFKRRLETKVLLKYESGEEFKVGTNYRYIDKDILVSYKTTRSNEPM